MPDSSPELTQNASLSTNPIQESNPSRFAQLLHFWKSLSLFWKSTTGLFILILIVIISLHGLRLYNQSRPVKSTVPDLSATSSKSNSTKPASSQILRVGEESIFQGDLDYELANYPSTPGSDSQAIIRKKLINDSITLQAAAAEKWVTLTDSIYNSPTKDYPQRLQAIANIRNKVDQLSTNVEGAVISVWFMNVSPGPIGYEAGKQLAYQKISSVYTQAKEGKLTLKQVGEQLAADTELAQVDPSYKVNAYIDFKSNINQEITFDPQFDQLLRSLNPGQLTDIYLAQDHPKNDESLPKQDAVYMFGGLTGKSSGTAVVLPFTDWVKSKSINYAIKDF